MDNMRHARWLAAAGLPLAALSMQPASAQLFPGQPPFPCHVLHVTNQTHNPALVTVSVDPGGVVRVGFKMVAACTTADIQLAPNLRCGATFNVRGEVKDPSKVPVAIYNLNPAAAPTISDVKGTFTPQNAAEPANWLALVGVPGKEVGWKPVPAGTKMPQGCPAPPPPPAPAVVVFTFNNTTASPVLLSAGGQTVVFKNACIGAGQSRSVQVAPSTGYKVLATPMRDGQCQQPIAAPLGLGPRPVNGRVTVVYAASPYALRQLETPPPLPPPAAPPPVDPSQSTSDTTVSTDPNAPAHVDPTQDPTISVPTGK
jgi:hypothetical protein